MHFNFSLTDRDFVILADQKKNDNIENDHHNDDPYWEK